MANFLKSLFVKGVEIDTASATAGKVLTYDGTKFAPATPGAGSLALDDLSDVVITTPASGNFLKYNGSLWVADAIDLDTDTTGNYMSGISGTSPVSVTHTPAEGSSATVALASGYGDTQNPYASKTANYVLAAPNGTAGVPTFRAIVAADIPTLNQNTTGTAATVTGAAQTAITSVGTLTGLTIGGAGANRSITINAPSSYYAIQYFQINGVSKWHYEVQPDGTKWSLVQSGVAERIGVTSTGATFSGTVTATTFVGALTGTASGNLVSGGALGTPSSGTLTNCTFPTLNQNTTGSAATLTTARTLWGQSFNGSAAISGSLTGVYDINTAASPINTIYASNWFRSTGSTGWYNQTHGGGIYMEDATFVRVYNGKIFYAAGGLWSADTGTASTSGYQYLLRGTSYGNYAPFTSMREVKRNIKTINNSGDLIDQLNPVTFQEKITESDDEVSIAWKNSDLEYGLIADEVALVGTGHLAQYQGMEDGTLKPVGWSFHGVISVLVAEVKDLRKRIAELESTK